MRWLVGLVLGGMLGGVLFFAVGIALPSLLPISQAEGAYAMQVAFFWAPLGLILGAILGVLLARRRPRA